MIGIGSAAIVGSISWSILISCMLVASYGVFEQKVRLLSVAIGLSVPVALYFLAFSGPPWLYVGGSLPLSLFLSRYAIKRELTLISWLLVLPTIGVITSLAWTVFTQ